jgi:putative ABC transport system permease protein
MQSIIEELKASSVLKKEEIEKIKLYIKKKYPDNSSKENAVILSKTIYGILDSNLDGINGEDKENIKKTIIQDTILKDKKDIFRFDIFNACISKLEENPALKTSITNWINKNQRNSVSQETINSYISNLHKVNNIEDSSYLLFADGFSSTVSLENKKVLKKVNKFGEKVCTIKEMLQDFKLKNENIYYKEVVIALLILLIFSSSATNSLIMRSDKIKVVANKINAVEQISVLVDNKNSRVGEIYVPVDKKSNEGIKISVPVNKKSNKVEEVSVPVNNMKKEDGQASVTLIPTTDASSKKVIVTNEMSYHPNLPNYFNYKNINKDKLLEFLNVKNSILAEEPYFSAIINVSQEFNLNPHILFAITGQEQSFVPKNRENAERIANNPFNVFHSWQEYNTDIYDSSRIVSRTIISLAKNKPTNIEIFDWINKKYADDDNWASGVRHMFEILDE